MLVRRASYEQTYRDFRWNVPQRYNIGVDACDRHADGSGRLALVHLPAEGPVRTYSFDDIRAASNRLANVLAGHGLRPGDRLAILLPQAPETAIAHIAAYKAGLIAVPLFTLFGHDALHFRLCDSAAAGLVTDRAGSEKILAMREALPDLKLVLTIDGAGPGSEDFHGLLERASDRFVPVDTGPEDPAVIIYTSGTTGNPKGALHGHRVLLGHLPGVEMPHEFFPQSGDRFWTPADWAWIGGLLDVLLPSWHHGVPVVSHRMAKFDPEHAFALMAAHQVRNVFLPPTALKLMRQVPDPQGRWSYRLRSIGSGGETLGAELLDWARATFALTVNEFYGQTECNLVVANCAGLLPVQPGSMGRPVPGHAVAIIGPDGHEVAPGTTGDIAVRAPDPVMFLGYWNQPQASAGKFRGSWLITGDLGRQDEAGHLWFVGRSDDVITSAGYRIGPGEVEDCLMKHPAVAMAAVVGVPDPVRTEIVKAFIVAAPGVVPSPALKSEIQQFVKTRLAAHEYPRIVEFVDDLPMTTTGKIMRRVLRGGKTTGSRDRGGRR
jgi:acetyl-CoA synthetase